MALQQAAIPTYKETSIVFTANSEYFLNRTCEIVAVIELSGSVEMSINDGDYTTCRGGIIYKMPDGAEIFSIKFREVAGAGANLIVATGNGAISDNRASFAGNLSVVNAASPNGSLQVDTIAADPGLVALAATLITALQASESLRSRLIDLTGYTHATHSNTGAEADIVSSAANTDGIIVQSCHILKRASTGGYYSAGTAQPFIGDDGEVTNSSEQVSRIHQPIFIPAGLALRERFESALAVGHIWYKVL